MHSLIFPYKLVDKRYMPVIPLQVQARVWLYLKIAHALHGKTKKLIYRSPVTGDVVIFDHSPYFINITASLSGKRIMC